MIALFYLQARVVYVEHPTESTLRMFCRDLDPMFVEEISKLRPDGEIVVFDKYPARNIFPPETLKKLELHFGISHVEALERRFMNMGHHDNGKDLPFVTRHSNEASRLVQYTESELTALKGVEAFEQSMMDDRNLIEKEFLVFQRWVLRLEEILLREEVSREEVRAIEDDFHNAMIRFDSLVKNFLSRSRRASGVGLPSDDLEDEVRGNVPPPPNLDDEDETTSVVVHAHDATQPSQLPRQAAAVKLEQSASTSKSPSSPSPSPQTVDQLRRESVLPPVSGWGGLSIAASTVGRKSSSHRGDVDTQAANGENLFSSQFSSQVAFSPKSTTATSDKRVVARQAAFETRADLDINALLVALNIRSGEERVIYRAPAPKGSNAQRHVFFPASDESRLDVFVESQGHSLDMNVIMQQFLLGMLQQGSDVNPRKKGSGALRKRRALIALHSALDSDEISLAGTDFLAVVTQQDQIMAMLHNMGVEQVSIGEKGIRVKFRPHQPTVRSNLNVRSMDNPREYLPFSLETQALLKGRYSVGDIVFIPWVNINGLSSGRSIGFEMGAEALAASKRKYHFWDRGVRVLPFANNGSSNIEEKKDSSNSSRGIVSTVSSVIGVFVKKGQRALSPDNIMGGIWRGFQAIRKSLSPDRKDRSQSSSPNNSQDWRGDVVSAEPASFANRRLFDEEDVSPAERDDSAEPDPRDPLDAAAVAATSDAIDESEVNRRLRSEERRARSEELKAQQRLVNLIQQIETEENSARARLDHTPISPGGRKRHVSGKDKRQGEEFRERAVLKEGELHLRQEIMRREAELAVLESEEGSDSDKVLRVENLEFQLLERYRLWLLALNEFMRSENDERLEMLSLLKDEEARVRSSITATRDRGVRELDSIDVRERARIHAMQIARGQRKALEINETKFRMAIEEEAERFNIRALRFLKLEEMAERLRQHLQKEEKARQLDQMRQESEARFIEIQVQAQKRRQRAQIEMDEMTDRHSGVMNDEFSKRLVLLQRVEESLRSEFEEEAQKGLAGFAIDQEAEQRSVVLRDENLVRQQVAQLMAFDRLRQNYARWLVELDSMKLLEQESGKRTVEENAESFSRGLLEQSKQRAQVEMDEAMARSRFATDALLRQLTLLLEAEEDLLRLKLKREAQEGLAGFAIDQEVEQRSVVLRDENLVRQQVAQMMAFDRLRQNYASWLAELDYMKLLEQESAKRIDEENAELLNRGLLGQSKQRARVEMDETADRHSGVMNDEFLARLALLLGAEEGLRSKFEGDAQKGLASFSVVDQEAKQRSAVANTDEPLARQSLLLKLQKQRAQLVKLDRLRRNALISNGLDSLKRFIEMRRNHRAKVQQSNDLETGNANLLRQQIWEKWNRYVLVKQTRGYTGRLSREESPHPVEPLSQAGDDYQSSQPGCSDLIDVITLPRVDGDAVDEDAVVVSAGRRFFEQNGVTEDYLVRERRFFSEAIDTFLDEDRVAATGRASASHSGIDHMGLSMSGLRDLVKDKVFVDKNEQRIKDLIFNLSQIYEAMLKRMFDMTSGFMLNFNGADDTVVRVTNLNIKLAQGFEVFIKSLIDSLPESARLDLTASVLNVQGIYSYFAKCLYSDSFMKNYGCSERHQTQDWPLGARGRLETVIRAVNCKDEETKKRVELFILFLMEIYHGGGGKFYHRDPAYIAKLNLGKHGFGLGLINIVSDWRVRNETEDRILTDVIVPFLLEMFSEEERTRFRPEIQQQQLLRLEEVKNARTVLLGIDRPAPERALEMRSAPLVSAAPPPPSVVVMIEQAAVDGVDPAVELQSMLQTIESDGMLKTSSISAFKKGLEDRLGSLEQLSEVLSQEEVLELNNIIRILSLFNKNIKIFVSTQRTEVDQDLIKKMKEVKEYNTERSVFEKYIKRCEDVLEKRSLFYKKYVEFSANIREVIKGLGLMKRQELNDAEIGVVKAQLERFTPLIDKFGSLNEPSMLDKMQICQLLKVVKELQRCCAVIEGLYRGDGIAIEEMQKRLRKFGAVYANQKLKLSKSTEVCKVLLLRYAGFFIVCEGYEEEVNKLNKEFSELMSKNPKLNKGIVVSKLEELEVSRDKLLKEMSQLKKEKKDQYDLFADSLKYLLADLGDNIEKGRKLFPKGFLSKLTTSKPGVFSPPRSERMELEVSVPDVVVKARSQSAQRRFGMVPLVTREEVRRERSQSAEPVRWSDNHNEDVSPRRRSYNAAVASSRSSSPSPNPQRESSPDSEIKKKVVNAQ